MEEPACRQVPYADGPLRWSGIQHQPDVHEAIGSKCLQLLGMHALTGCDTTSFPFNNDKVSALRVLEAGYFPGLFHVLREEDAMQWDLLEVGMSFFLLCTVGQKPWKRGGITCTQRRRPGQGFAIFRRIAPTCFFMCNVLVIFMERPLTLTLTSDHINNVRNEFLRSDMYKKMVLRMNLILLLKKVMIRHLLGRTCWILTNYKSSRKCPAGQLCGSAHPISSLWNISNYVICITIEKRILGTKGDI